MELVAEDEFAGAIGTSQCPSGGVHVYEITGAKERAPENVGYWNIDELGPTDQVEGRCTAHVLDIHERQQIMTIAWYNGGVHVVDLGNDIERGLDVYRFDGTARRPAQTGRWLSPAAAAAYLRGRTQAPVTRENALVCLLPEG